MRRRLNGQAPAFYWDIPGAEFEAEYLDLLHYIMREGAFKGDRTGTSTRSIFGHQMRFDLGAQAPQNNAYVFPLLTTKKLHFHSIVHELLWFLRGETNVRWLRENGVSIWDKWADVDGELGPVYGRQWRHWITADGRVIDQVAEVVQSIQDNPDSRRHIVTAWNPGEVDRMALPPCHMTFQFYVVDGTLSCQLYQRSADVFLGLPFNIASYALLTLMVAQVTGLKPGEFVHTLGDAHLYLNHERQAKTLIGRCPYAAPRVWLNPGIHLLDKFRADDIVLEGYEPHPAIPAPVAV